MEKNVSVWKANLTNGLILGIAGIVYMLVMYFLDLTFNRTQGWVFMLVLIVILYFLIKSYRDNYLYGYITYGKAFGSGVVIFLYYSIIVAIFTYILYTVIDTGLIDKQLAFSEEMMQKRNMPQEYIDSGMRFNRKIMTPAIIPFFGLFFNMFFGTIISLIVAIFVRKEGNPLIDAPEVK
jgi:hypothetical protein